LTADYSLIPGILAPQSLLALFIVQNVRVDAACLWYQEKSDNGANEIASEEDPKDVCDADLGGSAEVVEQYARQDCAQFSDGGADTVAETANTRRVDLGGDDEGGGVWTEVEEELRNCISVYVR